MIFIFLLLLSISLYINKSIITYIFANKGIKMKNIMKNTVAFSLTMILLAATIIVTQTPIHAQYLPVEWDVTLHFNETGGNIDTVVFGEAPDANDSGEPDDYDVMKPPAPPSPYIRSWFDDGLSTPFNFLQEDYRKYPDTYKVWNLSVQWVPSDYQTPTNITISWNINDLDSIEYDVVVLYDVDNAITVADMLIDTEYAFIATTMTPKAFQIRVDTDNGNNGSNGSNGGQPPVNTPPVANASASETSGFVGMYISFNGSLSYDPDEDGYIDSWEWDFGDGETGTGDTTEHVYFESGIFNVTLTVIDNKGATGTDVFNVNIIQLPNIPPEKPVVTGPDIGHKDIVYEYTANSTDVDNNTISYIFNWGDGDIITTDYLPKGIMTTQNHSWDTAGRYTIEVQATDNQTYSQTTELIVMINAINIDDIGYITDDDGDGTYDTFHSSGLETDLGQENGKYLIDVDGDGDWDYFFDLSEGISVYTKSDDQGKITIFVVVIVISVILLVLLFKIFWKRTGV